jgi:hypothetical protein
MPARKTLERYKNYNVKTETPENDLWRSGISQEILWRPLIRRTGRTDLFMSGHCPSSYKRFSRNNRVVAEWRRVAVPGAM